MRAAIRERRPRRLLAAVLALAVILAGGFGSGLAQPGCETGPAPVGTAPGDAAGALPLRRISTGPSIDCRYAWFLESQVADRLAYEARQLAACAERGDVRDACQDSFWRVRNAQTDYESAVSSLRSACRRRAPL